MRDGVDDEVGLVVVDEVTALLGDDVAGVGDEGGEVILEFESECFVGFDWPAGGEEGWISTLR